MSYKEAYEISGCLARLIDVEKLDIFVTQSRKALEKQIPRKPKALLNHYPDGQYECACGCPVMRCYSYCLKCGQAILWEE